MTENSMTRETALQTLQNIRTAAEAALTEGVSAIMVTVFREHPPTGEAVLLCGQSGPRGLVINAKHDGERNWKVTARFQAARLITFCNKAIESILKS